MMKKDTKEITTTQQTSSKNKMYILAFFALFFTACFSMYDPFQETTWENIRTTALKNCKKKLLTTPCLDALSRRHGKILLHNQDPETKESPTKKNKKLGIKHTTYLKHEASKINAINCKEDSIKFLIADIKIALWLTERIRSNQFGHNALFNTFEPKQQGWISELLYALKLLSNQVLLEKDYCYCLCLLEHFYICKGNLTYSYANSQSFEMKKTIIKHILHTIARKKKDLIEHTPKKIPNAEYIGLQYFTVLKEPILLGNSEKFILDLECYKKAQKTAINQNYESFYNFTHKQFRLFDKVTATSD